MRKQLLRTISALLALSLLAGAETPATDSGEGAALRKVNVVDSSDGIQIEMTTTGGVSPKVEALSRPARIVVDLPHTRLRTSPSRIAVGRDGVLGVRIGTDAKETTRIVVDLERPAEYKLLSGAGDQLSLKIAATSEPAETADAKPGRPATVMPAALPKTAAIKPADFVFIEPTYSSKAAEAPVEPPARAREAASKFVERPEGNLLPAASGAMAPAAQASASTPAQAPAQPIQPAVNLAAEQKEHPLGAAGGPKYTGEPISVNLKDVDLKDFFRLIHEISGLNVVLDPDVRGTLTIVLDDVPWDQALDIVLKNNALSRQLDGNVLRIATVDTLRKEAEAKRAEQEAEALAADKVTVTRFLSYAHSRDVVATIKKFLSQRGDVVSDDRTNAVIISDIPAAIPPIDKLIQQLDRKTQEVEIEARVVAATRSFARDIGTQLGFGWGNASTGVGGANSAGASPISVFNTPGALYPIIGTSAPTSGQGVQIPLFSNLGVVGPTSGLSLVNASNNIRLDAILTMAESRGLLKVLSRPRVVTQNNILAVVKQGVRIPAVTAA
jgi:type IV pilus assembly protein PilQ